LMPLTVLIFGRVVSVAPIVNLFAVPVFSVVTVPSLLIGLILDGWAQPLGDKALLVAAASLGLVEMLIAVASQVTWASIAIPAISGTAWITIGVPLLWVTLPPGWPCRLLLVPALLALGLHVPARPDNACADIDVLDVGQGLSIVVTTRSKTVIFDTGPAYRSGSNAAESLVLPFLEKRGIDSVDTLIVSHADLDHAGGVESLLAGVKVRDLRAGEPLTTGAERRCIAGDHWQSDGIRFSFVHPLPDSEFRGNDASCVLLIEAGNYRALLTGDIERPAEAGLARAGSLPAVDVVIVPHHGSRTSSSPAFVAALKPTVAIVSASHGNRWGFPKDDVVGRWQAAGAEVLGTAESGAISMRLCGQGGLVSLTRQRDRKRRIWHE
jgi:competence protein ComEC